MALKQAQAPTEMNAKNLSGPRIKIARTNKDMDQVDLSAALDLEYNVKLDQSDISEIERQVRGVKDFELDAIARVLDVSLSWLVRGDGEDI